MKAIVAEIDKKQMIVITDKGDFIKVRRQMSVGIGDEIELKPQKLNLTYRRLASIAACFLACIFLSTGVYAYYTPYSYVSVDINPSIALSLNRFERVISVDPLNEDAVSLIQDTKSLKNQDIDEALSNIIKSAAEKGYIDKMSENQVMVVVSAKNEKQEAELASEVNIAAAKELAKVNKNSEVMVEKTSVESYKEALSNKVSPGKEILASKLREVNPEIKDEDIREMSVKEVVHLIKEGRKAVMAAEKDKDKGKEDREDSGKNAGTNKDKEGQKGKEAAKVEQKTEKENKKNDKPKPTTAASKDDKAKNGDKDKGASADSGKSDEGKPGEGDGSKAAVEDKDGKDDENKDKDADDDKKKDNDEGNKNKKAVEGKVGQDGQPDDRDDDDNDSDEDKDEDSDGDREKKDKEKRD